MKIAVLHFGRHGAGPVYSYEMAKALSSAGHNVLYYASSSVENRFAVENAGFTCKLFETYHSKLTYLISIVCKRTINAVVNDIWKEEPDVVYCPMNDLWTPFIFRKIKNITRVKTIHDVGVHEGNDSIFNRIWNKSQFEDAEKFVILSKGFKQNLIKKGIDPAKIQVIPHAGFDYYIKAANQRQSIVNGIPDNTLLFFGRIDKYKGLNVLLAAMENVLKVKPEIKLIIAGNGDITPYRTQIEKIKDNVVVKNGWIADEDVASIVKLASVVILPYTHATQSGVIPLAYAFSKPVIATNVGCLAEQIIDGETGYIIEGGNARAVSNAIIKMFDNPENIAKMGEKANKYVKENLTWGASAQLLVDFLSK